VTGLFRLDGKVAAITGGASGIGLATVRLFSEAGAKVIILDRDLAAADVAAEGIANCTACALDVAHPEAVDAEFNKIGLLDVLVNCAGIALRHPAIDQPLADWDKVVAVNMTGSFLCARAAARTMIVGGGGAIVNTASIMGLSGGGLYPNISYQTTKGAIVNMTRALAVEWAGNNIRVNAVAPTYVNTPFIAALANKPELMARIKAMTPLGRLATPQEIASAILFLSSPAAAMITGHTLPVDGGFLAQ
jgi:NAD(P)-dependent dehydrogenase (short-subunit alcohol dehydrogenase family)